MSYREEKVLYFKKNGKCETKELHSRFNWDDLPIRLLSKVDRNDFSQK